jgi:ParB family transcriptional regulator, chromosome partitioning protein
VSTVLRDIEPEKILANPENPRMYFRDPGLNQLADSIEESGGVLVPIYVYPDPEKDGLYRLIDGERRWRIAQRLGLETIPALVRDSEPDPEKNIIEMFNIHKVREDWEDMPTARALKQVIERTGKTDIDDLRELTGLNPDQIRRYQLLLELPVAYQEMVESGELTMNFFVELDRNVIRPLETERTELAKEFDREALLEAFVTKRRANRIRNITDFRKVKPIIDRARADAGAADQPSELDAALETLFRDPEVTIDEAYDSSVAFGVEVDKIGGLADQIAGQVARLFGETTDPDERAQLVQIVTATRDRLDALLAEHAD